MLYTPMIIAVKEMIGQSTDFVQFLIIRDVVDLFSLMYLIFIIAIKMRYITKEQRIVLSVLIIIHTSTLSENC